MPRRQSSSAASGSCRIDASYWPTIGQWNSARAFDVLMTLIEARGAVVSKDELIERVWPGRIVEENNLQAQVSALRRAFAADRDLIRTVAGRGYRFTGEIRTISAPPDAELAAWMPEAAPVPSRPPTNLPEPVSELIGRDAELAEVLDLSTSHRLVTLTGAGGIGKTRLGFAVARQQLSRFADGVWAAELAPLSDPDLVPVTVATALGLELASGTASPQSVASGLNEDVEYNPALIDGAPEIVLHALDSDEDFIHVPLVPWPWPVATRAVGKTRSEFPAPASHRLVGDDNAGSGGGFMQPVSPASGHEARLGYRDNARRLRHRAFGDRAADAPLDLA